MMSFSSILEPDLFFIVPLFFSLAILFLVIALLDKFKKVKILQKRIVDLEKHLEAMDEQAQLIVKTDLELSRTQEELDRKVISLMALQNLSQELNSSFEEEKIFSFFNEETIHKLGYEFCLIVLVEGNELKAKKYIGQKSVEEIGDFLIWSRKRNIPFQLSKKGVIYNDSSFQFEPLRNYLYEKIGLKTFTISPLYIEKRFAGFIMLGNYIEESQKVSKGIIEILATQLAQTLENINLFERIYSAQRDLQQRIKERTKDLEKALEKVKKANRLKTEFVSAVSHEFRTPLTSIKGYASLLVRNKFGELPEAIKIRLERINQQADTLVGMINDLLDISRIESGRMRVDMGAIDLGELVERIKDYLYPQVDKKNINLTAKVNTSLEIEADKQLMERALINILNNAVKFTPEGKSISVALEDKGEYTEISVEDEGPGISPEDKDNIFKEFYRTDDASGTEGSGLGLSLVKNIVDIHKGEIKLYSELGKGTKFVLSFPKSQSGKNKQ